MKKRLKLKKHVKVLAVFIFLCILTVTIYNMKPNKNLEKITHKANSYQEQNQTVKSTSLEESKEKNMVNATNKDYIYLSDIPYDTLKSKSGWGSFYKDQASDGTKITIRYENGEWTFDKGMWAHATSTLVYDLTNYRDYDYFTTFAGLNISAKNNSDGVIFRIYTSTDGRIWDKQEESPLLKGTSNL